MDFTGLTAHCVASAGSLWFQLEEDHLYVQNCLGVIYMTITMLSFTSFSSVASYIDQNGVFHRYHP
jgi:hypothetical protein